jgi:hypothetical protein
MHLVADSGGELRELAKVRGNSTISLRAQNSCAGRIPFRCPPRRCSPRAAMLPWATLLDTQASAILENAMQTRVAR